MVTVIGSPPNGIYVRFMEQTYGETVSFIDWLKIGLPVALLLLPATYFLLVNVLFPCKMEGIPGGKDWSATSFASSVPCPAVKDRSGGLRPRGRPLDLRPGHPRP